MAYFITMNELADTIERCLRLLKSWAPGWDPVIAITDQDSAEILAVETVFPDIIHILCEFHVKQNWLKRFRCLGGEISYIKNIIIKL